MTREGGRRPVVAILDVDGIWLRQKGCRVKYQLPYETAWDCAVKGHVQRLRAERQARRKR